MGHQAGVRAIFRRTLANPLRPCFRRPVEPRETLRATSAHSPRLPSVAPGVSFYGTLMTSRMIPSRPSPGLVHRKDADENQSIGTTYACGLHPQSVLSLMAGGAEANAFKRWVTAAVAALVGVTCWRVATPRGGGVRGIGSQPRRGPIPRVARCHRPHPPHCPPIHAP